MDTAFYYYRSKGEQKGPYKFYQLQQLKTEEHVTPEDFDPEEWEHFARFVETGEITKSPYIQRVDETVADKPKEKPLLKYLTRVGYAVALLFVAQGLLQGDNDYLFRSQPAFYLGLAFSIALCHMSVDRAIRTRLARSLESPMGALLLWYVGGLLPLAATIAVVAAVAQTIIRSDNLTLMELVDTGIKYFAAGAAASIYRPFYLRTIAIDEKLIERKPHSISWLVGLVLVLALMTFYVTPARLLPGVIGQWQDYLFVTTKGPAIQSKLKWQFPLRLGDGERTVERLLGAPEEVVGRERIYRSAGVRVTFDDGQRVARLRFINDEETKLFKKSIISGISPRSTLRHIQSILNTPPATFSEASTETSVWVEPPYRIMGCFWKEDSNTDGKPHKAGDLKWIEITLEQ